MTPSEANILFTEVEPEDEAMVRARFPESQIIEEALKEDEIIQKYQETEVLCVFIYTQITQKVIQGLPHLKLIVTRSVGYDHIDLQAAKERGIAIVNVPDYGSHVIAEHVFALLLSTVRCVRKGDEKVESCEFDFHGLRGMALKGKTLGIVGTGKIGKNVARIASMGFLMNVLAYDKYPDTEAAREYHFTYTDSLDKVWAQSDIISLHLPFFPETKHLINRQSIAKMKDGVVLINTARGGLIDTTALIEGIKSHKIAHCALDVLEHESNVHENQELISLPHVITTPHIAFYADDSMKRMHEEALSSIERFLKGEELIHQVQGT